MSKVTQQMIDAGLAAKVRDYRAEAAEDEIKTVERAMLVHGFHHPIDGREMVHAILSAGLRFNTDLTTAAVERLTAQLGEALFGEPGLSLMEIANRCNAEAVLAGGALLGSTAYPIAWSWVGRDHSTHFTEEADTAAEAQRLGKVVRPLYGHASASPKPAKPEAVRLRDELRERGTLAATLRAMATNYSGGHSWDHLDADVCRRAADALASVQPSPAGQGDYYQLKFLALLQEVLDAKNLMLEAGCEQSDFPAMFAEFAARQPVGQEPVRHEMWNPVSGWDECTKEEHEDWQRRGGGKTSRALYAAPPAQAVDLGQLRKLADYWDRITQDKDIKFKDRELVAMYDKGLNKCARELRALIDSGKAVQS